ncbi:hypothetical protein ACS0TY_008803 [Phlomoides rotata]
MKWPADFQCSPLEESLFVLHSSPQLEMQQKSTGWTFEENKLFENVLPEMDSNSLVFIENASRVPWKFIEDAKNHCQALLDDIEAIGSGKVPHPDYPNLDIQDNQDVTMMQQDHLKRDEGSTSNANPKIRSNGHQRRKGVLWTEEHRLMGLNKYRKGDWRSISRYYVISKTPTQVASHAQKYFNRQTSSTSVGRRHPSIHDIQIGSHIPTPIPQRHATHGVDPPLPNILSCGLIPSLVNFDMINGDDPLSPNHMFISPMNNLVMNNSLNFPSSDLIFNQNDSVFTNTGVAAFPSVAFMLPSMMNQQWG